MPPFVPGNWHWPGIRSHVPVHDRLGQCLFRFACPVGGGFSSPAADLRILEPPHVPCTQCFVLTSWPNRRFLRYLEAPTTPEFAVSGHHKGITRAHRSSQVLFGAGDDVAHPLCPTNQTLPRLNGQNSVFVSHRCHSAPKSPSFRG